MGLRTDRVRELEGFVEGVDPERAAAEGSLHLVQVERRDEERVARADLSLCVVQTAERGGGHQLDT